MKFVYPKMVRTFDIFYILISKYVSYYNNKYVFDILIFEIPKIIYFIYFDFDMCIALYRHIFFWYFIFLIWFEYNIILVFLCRYISHNDNV